MYSKLLVTVLLISFAFVFTTEEETFDDIEALEADENRDLESYEDGDEDAVEISTMPFLIKLKNYHSKDIC